MTVQADNDKPFYSTPGPDDSFLRPTLNHSWAPREVAVEFSDETLWISWIHRTQGSDTVVATRKKAGGSAPLAVIHSNRRYSKPAWLRFPGNRTPLLYFGRSVNHDKFIIEGYALQNGSWQLVETLPTQCIAIYHMNMVAVAGDKVYLTYCGINERKPGIQFSYRLFHRGFWGDELHFPDYDGQVNRSKLIIDKKYLPVP